MVIYFDVLFLDDRSLLDVRHLERFKLLEQIVHPIIGRAELVSRRVIDFGHAMAVSEPRKAFANVIMKRGEGLVLKPDEPYFNFHHYDQPFGGRCIKLKKEYIGNFGDVGDFAVVGAGFTASKAKSYSIPNLEWTCFYVGCLDNKEQVQRWNARPEFTVVSGVELNETQLRAFVKFGNSLPVPIAENTATHLRIPKGIETGPPLAFAFERPLVFDLRCFSFDKPGKVGFWTLRFPLVSKIHFDRDFTDTVSFAELQQMAKKATSAAQPDDSQENLAWITRLEGADPRGLPADVASQLTVTTLQTPSPAKSNPTSTAQNSSVSPASATQRLHACIRPRGPGESHQGPAVLASAQLLVAPPMLPPLPEMTSPDGQSGSPHKRPVASSTGSPQPHKRHRRLAPETVSTTEAQTVHRKPLVDVDANASHHSGLRCEPNAGTCQTLESRLRDEKQRALDGMQPTMEASHSQERNGPRPDSDEGGGDLTRRTLVTGPVGDLTNKPPGGRYPDVAVGGGTDASATAVDIGCSYAERECHMARFSILVTPTLLAESAEAAKLLKAHGVFDAASSADEWLDLASTGRAAPTESKKTSRRCSSLTAWRGASRRNMSWLALRRPGNGCRGGRGTLW